MKFSWLISKVLSLAAMMKPRFSQRHGYVEEPPITVREDAPESIRAALLAILTKNLDMRYGSIREVVCPILDTFPDASNWSEVPNVRDEVMELIRGCPWYKFYDICEALYSYGSAQQSDRPRVFIGFPSVRVLASAHPERSLKCHIANVCSPSKGLGGK